MTVAEWFKAHDAYYKASELYNQRLELVRAERERGNWTMNVNAEYTALNQAQSAALQADRELYVALVSKDGQGVTGNGN